MNVFHYAHLGKLTGLGSIVSAVFCLLNDPLFKIVNNILDQDPFWVRRNGKPASNTLVLS